MIGDMNLPGPQNAPQDKDCNDSIQRPDERESYDVRVLEAQEQKSDEKGNHTNIRVKMDWRARDNRESLTST